VFYPPPRGQLAHQHMHSNPSKVTAKGQMTVTSIMSSGGTAFCQATITRAHSNNCQNMQEVQTANANQNKHVQNWCVLLSIFAYGAH
jgi:hypothetical protein